MATRKNPLSALLNTDSRQQAEDFTRDHVVRSTVREAGTYGVGVQRTLPASQTSLGRLSASLGTMSGILNQFTQYQTQLEQAQLRKAGIEHQIEMQGIRSEQLDEAVKQQNIRLAPINQQRADVEFKQKLASMLPEESEEFFNEHAARVAEAKEAASEAEKRVHKDHGGINRNNPLLSDVNQRFIGAGRAQVYKDKFIEHQKDFFERMPEMENGAAINDEEAQKLADDFIESFMEENNIDKNSAIGKGFLMSVSKFNEVEIPKFGRAIAERSEGLATQNMLTAMKNYGETNTNFDDIEEQPWFAVLNSLPQDKFLAAIQGTKNSPGLIGLMSHSADSANRLQLMFGQLKDRIQIGGDDLGEFRGYDLLMASIEDSATQAAAREAAQDASAADSFMKDAISELQNKAILMSQDDKFDARKLLLPFDATPEQIRENLLKFLPDSEAAINRIPANRLIEVSGEVYRRIDALQTDDAKAAAYVMGQITKTRIFPDTPAGLKQVLGATLQKLDATGEAGLDAGSMVKAIVVGLSVDGDDYSGTFQKRSMADLDKDSGGLIFDYTNKKNKLHLEVQRDLGADINSEAFKEEYLNRIDELNKNFENSLFNYFMSAAKEREAFMSSVTEKEYTNLSKRFPEIEVLDSDFMVKRMEEDRSVTPSEAVELAKEYKKSNKESVASFLNSLESSKVNPSTLEGARSSTTKLRQSVLESYTKADGENFSELARLTDILASYSNKRTNLGSLSVESQKAAKEKYNQIINDANKAQAERLKLSVGLREVMEIAALADVVPSGGIPLVQAEHYLNKKEGLFPNSRGEERTGDFYYDRERFNPRGRGYGAHMIDADGQVITGPEWDVTRRDITIPRRLLMANKPPIVGLKFEKKAPATEADVDAILKVSLKAEGDTSGLFHNVAKRYGYKTRLELFQAQYKNLYYTNQRKLNK